MLQTEDVLAAQRIQRRLLEAPVRAQIYERVVRVPGIHLRRIVRDLELAMGTVEHHVHLLERHGLIFHHKGARRKSFYARENVDPGDVLYLHVLRNRVWRKIILDVMNHPEIAFGELAQGLPCSPSTSAYHLRRLLSMGILARTTLGRNTYYRLTEPERVQALLETYRATFQGLLGNEQLLKGPAANAAATVFDDLVRRIPKERVLPAPPLGGERTAIREQRITVTS